MYELAMPCTYTCLSHLLPHEEHLVKLGVTAERLESFSGMLADVVIDKNGSGRGIRQDGGCAGSGSGEEGMYHVGLTVFPGALWDAMNLYN